MKIKNKKWNNINLGIIAFTVVIILFEFIPRIMDLSSQTLGWISDTIKLEETSDIDAKLIEQSVRNKNLKSQMKQVVSEYEDDKNISTVMEYLNDIASKSNINISSIKALKLKKDNRLWLQPVEIEFTSSYEQLYNFTRFIEHSSKVILVNKLVTKPEVITKGKLTSNLLVDVYLNL